MTSQSIADDVTMTRELWRDHVNNGIDIYIDDIDFIHGDIRGRLCKKYRLTHWDLMKPYGAHEMACYPRRHHNMLIQ